MAAPKKPDNPFRRQSFARRAKAAAGAAGGAVGRTALRVPRKMLEQFRGAPRSLQAVFVLVCLGAAAGVGYYLTQVRPAKLHSYKVLRLWREMEEATAKLDLDEMNAILDRILALNPSEPRAAERKRMLATGVGDPDDQQMIPHLVRMHLRGGRLADAAREAQKRLAVEPKDWFANLVCALAAREKSDPAGMTRHLDAMPEPDDKAAGGVGYWMLLQAIAMREEAGRDPMPVRRYIATRVLPAMKQAVVRDLPPMDRVNVLDCYLQAFALPDLDPAQLGSLQGQWAVITELADRALAGAAAAREVPVLVRLGHLGPRLAGALGVFRQKKMLPPAMHAQLLKELTDRTRTAWQTVLDLDPKQPEAYGRLADLYLAEGNAEKVQELTEKGIAACGEDPRVVTPFCQLLVNLGETDKALAQLMRSAETRKNDVGAWLLVARGAEIARRRDIALDALANARRVLPNAPGLSVGEAKLWLDGGDPAKALEAVRRVPPEHLLKDPAAARCATRAMIEAGQPGLVPEFLAQVEAAAKTANAPDPLAAALRGVYDAPPDVARAKDVIARTRKLLDHWRDHREARFLLAQGLHRLAEIGDPQWPVAVVSEAAGLYEQVRAKDPSDLRVAMSLGWLRLRGLRNPAYAAADLAPVRTWLDGNASGPSEMYEVVAAVHTANRQPQKAIDLLGQARLAYRLNAGCLIQLALAYREIGDLDRSRATLQEANDYPQTERERNDYLQAVQVVNRPSS